MFHYPPEFSALRGSIDDALNELRSPSFKVRARPKEPNAPIRLQKRMGDRVRKRLSFSQFTPNKEEEMMNIDSPDLTPRSSMPPTPGSASTMTPGQPFSPLNSESSYQWDTVKKCPIPIWKRNLYQTSLTNYVSVKKRSNHANKTDVFEISDGSDSENESHPFALPLAVSRVKAGQASRDLCVGTRRLLIGRKRAGSPASSMSGCTNKTSSSIHRNKSPKRRKLSQVRRNQLFKSEVTSGKRLEKFDLRFSQQSDKDNGKAEIMEKFLDSVNEGIWRHEEMDLLSEHIDSINMQ